MPLLAFGAGAPRGATSACATGFSDIGADARRRGFGLPRWARGESFLPRRFRDAERCAELIRRKRDGGALADDEIRAFIDGYTDGAIPDYQAAAMLMAIFFRGLDDARARRVDRRDARTRAT